MSEHWSLGVIIGLPLFSLLVILLIGGAIAFYLADMTPLDFMLGAFALLVIGGMVFGYYPYSAQYHKWQPVKGEVQNVSSRFLGDGKSTTQRFVVTFTDGRTRSCDDTRCALVKPGDTLGLYCKRSFQWASTPGWDCNYVERNGSDQ